MRRLCEAATVHSDHKDQEQLSFKVVQDALNQRLEEFDEFEKYRGYLSRLCDRLPDCIRGNVHLLGSNHRFILIINVCHLLHAQVSLT